MAGYKADILCVQPSDENEPQPPHQPYKCTHGLHRQLAHSTNYLNWN